MEMLIGSLQAVISAGRTRQSSCTCQSLLIRGFPHTAGPRSHLLLDPGTLAALSIFRSERHPSLMGIGSAKEGFSVFGLLNRCATQMVRCSWTAAAAVRCPMLHTLLPAPHVCRKWHAAGSAAA